MVDTSKRYRALVLPNMGDHTVTESHYRLLERVFDAYYRAGMKVWFHVIVPSPEDGYYKYPEKFDKEGKNFDLIFVNCNRIRMVDEAVPSVDLMNVINVRKTKLYFDLVINQRDLSGPYIKKMVKAKTQMMNIDIPVINYPPGVRSEKRCKDGSWTFYGHDEMLLGIVGVFCDYMMVVGESEKDAMIETARKYLNASKVKEAFDRIFICPAIATDVELLRKKTSDVRAKKSGKLTIMYGGRFNSAQKNFDAVLRVMRKVYESGRDYRFLCCTYEPRDEELERNNPFIEFSWGTGFDRYVELIGESDIAISCSKDDGAWGITAGDQVLGGNVFIGFEVDWIKRLCSKYPFLCENENEMIKLILLVGNDLKRANSAVEELRNSIIEKRCGNEVWCQFISRVTEIANQYEVSEKVNSIGALALEASASLGKEFTDEELYGEMTKKSKAGRPFGNPGDIMNRNYLRREIIKAGIVDTCESKNLIFRRCV